jgi:nanoRNase/pAp phosphatase (c-di-AMP/oligoRNAs hydrolase)
VFGETADTRRMLTDEEDADIMKEMIGGGHTGAGAADV